MEYYSTVKTNEFESVVVRRMNLEPVYTESESRKQMSYIDTYTWDLKNVTDEPVARQEWRHRHIEWTCGFIWGCRG